MLVDDKDENNQFMTDDEIVIEMIKTDDEEKEDGE